MKHQTKLLTGFIIILLVTLFTSVPSFASIQDELTDGSAYIQYGVLNQDMKTSDNFIYKAGTKVARGSRNSRSISGPFYLFFAASTSHFQSTADIHSDYVTITDEHIRPYDQKNILIIDNPIMPSAMFDDLEPVVPNLNIKVTKTRLKRTIATAQTSRDAGRYTAASKQALETILQQAIKMDNNASATQKQVDGIITQLIYQTNNLVSLPDQGDYISYGKYVTVTSKNYNTWSNFNWKTKHSAKQVTGKTYLAKGKYEHLNGATYLSLYDTNNKWQGYINAKATKEGNGKQGAYLSDGRHVTISKKGYNTWSNFNWKKKQTTNQLYGKRFVARGRYQHINGSTYYSLFDSKGKWYGYLNQSAVK